MIRFTLAIYNDILKVRVPCLPEHSLYPNKMKPNKSFLPSPANEQTSKPLIKLLMLYKCVTSTSLCHHPHQSFLINLW